jgi:hypothetical protein
MIQHRYAYIHSRAASPRRSRLLRAAHKRDYEFGRLSNSQLKRRVDEVWSDISLIAVSWCLFVGMLVFPVTQLVGLLIYGIVLLVFHAQRHTHAVSQVKVG